MNTACYVQVVETPDGDFLATCGQLRVVGSTATEAEELLYEMLRMGAEQRATGSMPVVACDEDEVPDT